MKFPWTNAEGFEEADVVIFGVPDGSGSHSKRRGVSKAPEAIRKTSKERAVFERGGIKTKTSPGLCPLDKKIFDFGDVKKKEVPKIIEKILEKGSVPVVMGGDHSITREILRGVDKVEKGVSVVYFDAHPDFICSSREYYGSVVCDILDYRNIDFSSSIEIGIRDAEPEELVNIRKEHLMTIKAIDVFEKGVDWVFKEVEKRVGDKIYISLDMDVVDPAFAPGVSTPVPCGLTNIQTLALLKKISRLGVVGFDIMEVCPPYDFQKMTSHLAGKLIIETISCMKIQSRVKVKQ